MVRNASPDPIQIIDPSSLGGGTRGLVTINEAPDGVRTSFTTAVDFKVGAGEEEMVFVNGDLQRRDASCDYTVSESGGAGTGFDTITFNYTLISSDQITMFAIPA